MELREKTEEELRQKEEELRQKEEELRQLELSEKEDELRKLELRMGEIDKEEELREGYIQAKEQELRQLELEETERELELLQKGYISRQYTAKEEELRKMHAEKIHKMQAESRGGLELEEKEECEPLYNLDDPTANHRLEAIRRDAANDLAGAVDAFGSAVKFDPRNAAACVSHS
jgi:hypothetical protein